MDLIEWSNPSWGAGSRLVQLVVSMIFHPRSCKDHNSKEDRLVKLRLYKRSNAIFIHAYYTRRCLSLSPKLDNSHVKGKCTILCVENPLGHVNY